MSPSESIGWATLLATLITSLAGAIVSIVNAVRTKEVQKQTTTSNGKTLAHMIEDNHTQIQEKVIPVAEKADAVVDEQIKIMGKAEEILQEQHRVKEELREFKNGNE